MSPGSGVKSEYMKRYREPRWDEYAPCYRELLRYRLGRRLLEQAHAPWLWDAWGPDSPSDSSASPSPAPRGAIGEPAAPSAREEEQPVGERGAELRDTEKQDTVLPGTGTAGRSEDRAARCSALWAGASCFGLVWFQNPLAELSGEGAGRISAFPPRISLIW